MKTFTRIAASAGALWCLMAAAGAAQTPRPASLKPCAFRLDEVAEAMGFEVETTDPADMTTPVGRDVGCLYSVKGSDFVFGVRQTWDSTRPSSSPVPNGYRKVPGDPNGAVYASGTGSGSSGQLVYVVGKVQVTIFWRGGNLGDADGLQRLLHLRRLP